MIPLSSPRDRQRYSSPALAVPPAMTDEEEEEGDYIRGRSTVRNRVVGAWRRLKRKVELPQKWKAFTPIIALVGMTLLVSLTLLFFAWPILRWLEALGIRIRDMGFGGYVLCFSMVFITCFPPMAGFSTSVTFTGFALGFPMGFFPVYLGSLAGATTCFILARRWFQDYVKRTSASNPSLRAVIKAVEDKGFKILLLIRLAPYPFTLSNVMFSGTRVRTQDFILASSISLLKTTIHVYIGSNLESFVTKTNNTTASDQTSSSSQTHELVMLILSLILGVGVGVYLFFVARRAVWNALSEHTTSVDLERWVSEGDLDLPDLEPGNIPRVGDSGPYHSPYRLHEWRNNGEDGRVIRDVQRSELRILLGNPGTPVDLSEGGRVDSPR